MADSDPSAETLLHRVEPDRAMRLPKGRRTVGSACGSFGELLQGTLPEDGSDFLVTLPIERHATAHFYPHEGSDAITVHPDWKVKSLQLARDLLHRLDRKVGGQLYLASDIPCGKGLGSSSADLVATARAIEAYLGQALSMAELCRSLSEVEPTDGVMFPESVLYFHVRGALGERLGPLPDVEILSLDEGGWIDTLEYHRRGGPRHSAERRQEFGELAERLRRAFERKSLAEIGAVSTRSAYINQEANPKRHLERVHAVSRRTGGAGLVTTHSGTCLGILYDATEPDHRVRLGEAMAELDALGDVDAYTTAKRPGKGSPARVPAGLV